MCEEMMYLETSPNSKSDFPKCLSHSRNKGDVADAQRNLINSFRTASTSLHGNVGIAFSEMIIGLDMLSD